MNQATFTARNSDTNEKLERVVSDLTSGSWRWNFMLSYRDAARRTLHLLATSGLIEERSHPSGGMIYKVNGKLYGRIDGITIERFDLLGP